MNLSVALASNVSSVGTVNVTSAPRDLTVSPDLYSTRTDYLLV